MASVGATVEVASHFWLVVRTPEFLVGGFLAEIGLGVGRHCRWL